MPKQKRSPSSRPAARAGSVLIGHVLAAAGTRPDSGSAQSEKNAYAVRFAEHFGVALAEDLSPRFPGIEATTSRGAASVRGAKQLDVNFSTPQLGLALGMSLKSVHIREAKGAGRYTHNMKRNEEELRIEASGYHKRQPYAVMVGVLCLPFDSCADAKTDRTSSSFGSWVRHLRPFAGRDRPGDDPDQFERLYVALYESDGADLRFFDVRTAPPRNGRPLMEGPLSQSGNPVDAPARALSYDEFLDAVHWTFLHRNRLVFSWADGSMDPLSPAAEHSGSDA